MYGIMQDTYMNILSSKEFVHNESCMYVCDFKKNTLSVDMYCNIHNTHCINMYKHMYTHTCFMQLQWYAIPG